MLTMGVSSSPPCCSYRNRERNQSGSTSSDDFHRAVSWSYLIFSFIYSYISFSAGFATIGYLGYSTGARSSTYFCCCFCMMISRIYSIARGLPSELPVAVELERLLSSSVVGLTAMDSALRGKSDSWTQVLYFLCWVTLKSSMQTKPGFLDLGLQRGNSFLTLGLMFLRQMETSPMNSGPFFLCQTNTWMTKGLPDSRSTSEIKGMSTLHHLGSAVFLWVSLSQHLTVDPSSPTFRSLKKGSPLLNRCTYWLFILCPERDRLRSSLIASSLTSSVSQSRVLMDLWTWYSWQELMCSALTMTSVLFQSTKVLVEFLLPTMSPSLALAMEQSCLLALLHRQMVTLWILEKAYTTMTGFLQCGSSSSENSVACTKFCPCWWQTTWKEPFLGRFRAEKKRRMLGFSIY